MASMAGDSLEQRVVRLEKEVLFLSRSLHGGSKLGCALQPTPRSSQPEAFGLPSTALRKSEGSYFSQAPTPRGQEPTPRGEARWEVQESIRALADRVADLDVRMNKAVQRLSAAQDALQEHCAEMAVRAGVSFRSPRPSPTKSAEGMDVSALLMKVQESVSAAELRLGGRCAALERGLASLGGQGASEERLAELEARVLKHCSAVEAQPAAAEPVLSLVRSPRRELLAKAGASMRRAGSGSASSWDTSSTVLTAGDELVSLRLDVEDASFESPLGPVVSQKSSPKGGESPNVSGPLGKVQASIAAAELRMTPRSAPVRLASVEEI
uniref:Uncharacterized protein n=1 Tax=Alexandrium monilatum TaxID=311494 RepID=A0A7S4QEG8_9DINO